MNELSLQRGRGFSLGQSCVIKHPTLGEIEDFRTETSDEFLKGSGSDQYFDMVYYLIASYKDWADIMWFEKQIWYEDIVSEWEFFIQTALSDSEEIELTCFLNGETSYTKALKAGEKLTKSLNYFLQLKGIYVFGEKFIENSDKKQIVLFNISEGNALTEDCFKFSEVYYNRLVDFLKQIHWIKIEYDFEKGGSRTAKEYILKNRYKKRKKREKQYITLGSMNSSIIASGCNINTWELPIYMFYEMYFRLAKIQNYKDTISALHSDRLDAEKNPINWDKINWSSVIN